MILDYLYRISKIEKMADIKEENVVAKLQCVGYKSYIDEICETATSSLLNGKNIGLQW